MDRRRFPRSRAATALVPRLSVAADAASVASRHALVIVELNGGNDGLNTVIPFSDVRYRALRPSLAIARERVLALDDRTGLHPALRALMPDWRAGHLAIV